MKYPSILVILASLSWHSALSQEDLLLLLSSSVGNEAPNLFVGGDFESPVIGANWGLEEWSGQINVVSRNQNESNTRDANSQYAVKFTAEPPDDFDECSSIHGGAYCAHVNLSYAQAVGGNTVGRTHLSQPSLGLEGSEGWYSFSFKFNTVDIQQQCTTGQNDCWLLLANFHGPVIQGNSNCQTVWVDYYPFGGTSQLQYLASTTQCMSQEAERRISLQAETWYDVVMNIRWSVNPDYGFVKAKYRPAGGNWTSFESSGVRYCATLGVPERHYFKIGIYWHPGFEQNNLSVYYDNVRAAISEQGLRLEGVPSGPLEKTGMGAESFKLSQNYPNPFNPTTRIDFDMAKEEDVQLKVYNILGQHVRTLFRGRKDAGHHTVYWDSANDNGYQVSSGVYIYRMSTREATFTRKMLLIR